MTWRSKITLDFELRHYREIDTSATQRKQVRRGFCKYLTMKTLCQVIHGITQNKLRCHGIAFIGLVDVCLNEKSFPLDRTFRILAR